MRSLRFELQLWHSIILAAVLAGFGTILYVQFRRARLDEIDAELHAAARVLEGSLRAAFVPPFKDEPPPFKEFDPEIPFDEPPPPKPKWPKGKGPKDFDETFVGKGPKLRKDWSKSLDLPPSLVERYRTDEAPYFAVWLRTGDLLKTTARAGQTTTFWSQMDGPEPRYVQAGDVREVRLNGHLGSQILVARSIEKELSGLRRVGWQYLLIGVGVWALALAGGWFLSRRVLRPIEAISAAAQDISEKNLSRRIDAAGTKNELGQLAHVLNETFDRLEAAFDRQVRFVGDASHELRTPLSVLLSHLDLALSRERTPKEYQDSLRSCRRAAHRMRNLIESLLTLARLDSGEIKLDRQTMNLSEVVGDAAELVQPLAESRRLHLQTHLPSMPMEGDPERLGQVAANLLTNAIFYNREGGRILVSVRGNESEAILRVQDTGIGIPDNDLPQLFDRFYRGDPSRSTAPGHGLGLAIAKSIVDAHLGEVRVASKPDVGTTFEVRLPRKRK